MSDDLWDEGPQVSMEFTNQNHSFHNRGSGRRGQNNFGRNNYRQQQRDPQQQDSNNFSRSNYRQQQQQDSNSFGRNYRQDSDNFGRNNYRQQREPQQDSDSFGRNNYRQQREPQQDSDNFGRNNYRQQRDPQQDSDSFGRSNYRQQRDPQQDSDNFGRNNYRQQRDPQQDSDNFGRNNYRQQQQPDSNSTTIQVPTKFVGRIIGKGGSKISDLQFESGAKINVTKDQVDDQTVIKLNGSDEAIQKAQNLIAELTIERQPYPQSAPTEVPSLGPLPDVIDWQALAAECDRRSEEQWSKFPPIKKNFYDEAPEVANMTEKEAETIRLTNNNISVSRVFENKGEKTKIPNPVQNFEQAFHNFPDIMREIEKNGFSEPTPIQRQAWPILLSGEDLIGIAQTGTGKTLAFLLPALIHIDGQDTPRQEREGPAVLIMAPTRELALQIEREVNKYYYKGIKAVCIYGGGNRREQVNIVTRGVDIVIATPGRLNDLVQGGYLILTSITYVVLDEADRMLDMGFEPQIRKILYSIRPNRQTAMTSATWPEGVRRLADSYMKNPIQVYVGSLNLAAVHTVTQTIHLMPDDEDEKFSTFMEFARNLDEGQKIIVFCGKKTRADYLASELIMKGIDCQAIHGDREQVDREQAISDITDGSVQILIATDVASRGLDIEDITHVINYDFPRNIEEYVHRVGRTGRAGRSGESISYFTRADWANAKELIPILEEANQYVPEELFEMAKRYESWKERKDQSRSGGRGGGRFQSYGRNDNKW